MIVVEKIGHHDRFEIDLVVADDGVPLERWRAIANDEWERMFLDEWAGPRLHVGGDDVLVPLVRIVEARDDLWIGFEWVPRVPVRALLKDENARGGLPVPLVAALLHAGARGIGAVHALPFAGVHRDVTHHTLSFALDGRVRLDWRPWPTEEQRRHTTRTAGTIKGSFASMSPEQVRGLPMTPASDVWSLGVTAWTMLAGANPFRRDSQIDTLQAIFRNERGRLIDGRADAPDPIVDLIERMVTSEPERRPSCADVRATIERELAWALWDADTIAREVRAIAPRAVDEVRARDERVRAAAHAGDQAGRA